MSFFREVSHLMKWRITILSLSKPYRNMSLVFRLRNVKAALKKKKKKKSCTQKNASFGYFPPSKGKAHSTTAPLSYPQMSS